MSDAPAAAPPPSPAPAPAPGGGAKGKIEKPETIIILCIVTCGIYGFYWLWQRIKEVNTYMGSQVINPMFVFPGCFCPPIMLYALFLLAKSLPDMQKKAGIQDKDEVVLHFILMWLLGSFGIGQFVFQKKLNELWSK